MVPRLEPIEKPDGYKMQPLYRLMQQGFGKVLTPVKGVSARMPGSMERDRTFNEFRANCTGSR